MSETQTQTAAAPAPAPANDLSMTDAFTFPVKRRFRFNKDDTGFQRPAVEVEIPTLSFNGIVDVLQRMKAGDASGKKEFEFLTSIISDAISGEVKSYVSDNANAAQDNIPWDKYSFAAIANMPQGVRGVSAIPKELWEKFAKSYVAVMPTKSSATPEQAAARVGILVQKFRPLTGNPDRAKIIENLMATLAVYVEAVGADGEEYSPILEFLTKKADELKAETTVVTADALGF